MYRHLFWCFWAVCFLLGGCSSAGGDPQPASVQSLLEKAENDVAAQRFESAMEKALLALEQSEGSPSLKVQALSTIVRDLAEYSLHDDYRRMKRDVDQWVQKQDHPFPVSRDDVRLNLQWPSEEDVPW